jgi:oligosaccharide reducing-end xylanase
VDGKPLVDFQSGGLVAMNAVATLASTSKVAPDFVKALWEMPIPSGQWRYYDGLLYTFALLHASGQYKIWPPRKNS